MSDPNHIESPPAGANAGPTKPAADQRRIITDRLPVPPRRSRTNAASPSPSSGRRVRWIIGAIAMGVVGILLLVLNHQRTVRDAEDRAAFFLRQREVRIAAHQSKLDELSKAIATKEQSIAELEQRLSLPTVNYAVTGLWGNARPFAIYTARSPSGENGLLFVPSSLVDFPKMPSEKDALDPNRLRYGPSGEMIPPDGSGTFTSLDQLPAIDWNVSEIKAPKSYSAIPEQMIGPRGTVLDDVDLAFRLHASRTPAWIADRWQSSVALNKELAVSRDKLVELKVQFAEEQSKAEYIRK